MTRLTLSDAVSPEEKAPSFPLAKDDEPIIRQIHDLVNKEMVAGREYPNTILMGINTYLRFSDEVDVNHEILEFEGKRVYTFTEVDKGLAVCYIPYV